ncbi:hypothetical protein GCM10027275_39620 [Rhabdobacter roseus]|uniref:Uncharacterized protein n=1 Tax=Rhabdobacter roseus TaxID=1655419 RepID=A0A840TZS2_9BACT|nr:hypothetical protein [Rhabdobacter roseus]MBB5285668.1 hypothetical protein [Rhabdobacter roseus]
MNHFLRSIFQVLVCFCSFQVGAQSVDPFTNHKVPARGVISLVGGVGVAYYMGDLRDDLDFAHLGLGPTLALGASYRLTEHFSARGELRLYSVSADQRYSRNFQNNLSFRTTNPDLQLGLQADLFSFSRQARFNPYLVLGVGVTYLTPKARLDNKWYSLAPLTTENVRYNRLPFFFSGGIGLMYRTSTRWRLGLELSNNYLQSDYLDDASTVFPNPDDLPSDLARRLSNRSEEIGQPAPQPGWIRGNPGLNDTYLFFSLRAQYLLTTRHQMAERRKVRCPRF